MIWTETGRMRLTCINILVIIFLENQETKKKRNVYLVSRIISISN